MLKKNKKPTFTEEKPDSWYKEQIFELIRNGKLVEQAVYHGQASFKSFNDVNSSLSYNKYLHEVIIDKAAGEIAVHMEALQKLEA